MQQHPVHPAGTPAPLIPFTSFFHRAIFIQQTTSLMHALRAMQVATTFSLALEDFYGAISSASSGGTCSINSPSADILLSEAGRFAPIQAGVSTFTQFEVTGALSYVLMLDPSSNIFTAVCVLGVHTDTCETLPVERV